MMRLVMPNVMLVLPNTSPHEEPWQEYPYAVFETGEQANGALRLYVQQAGQNMQRDLDEMMLHLGKLNRDFQPGTAIYKRIED